MSWYAHRRRDGAIAIAMQEILPGYSLEPEEGEVLVEPIAGDDPELIAIRFPAARPETVDDKLGRIGLTKAELKAALANGASEVAIK